MLAVTAPSFGYILVYNAFGRVKAIDSETDTLVGFAVRGYLILDINDVNGDVDDNYWLAYGKDSEGTKVSTLSVPNLELSVNGKYETLYMDIDGGWYATILGKRVSRDIGFADKRLVVYTMSGNSILVDGIVLDGAQLLRGASSMVLTLNSSLTHSANADSDDIETVLDDVITILTTAGYY